MRRILAVGVVTLCGLTAHGFATSTTTESVADSFSPETAKIESGDNPLEPCSTPIINELYRLSRREGKYKEVDSSARKMLNALLQAGLRGTLGEACFLDVISETRWKSGKVDAPGAVEEARRALELKERLLGPNHAEVAGSLSNLAQILKNMGDYDLALDYFRKSLMVEQAARPPDSLQIAWRHFNLSICLREMGRYEEAAAHIEEDVRITLKVEGPESTEYAQSLKNKGSFLSRLGRADEALADLNETLRIYGLSPGSWDHRTAQVHSILGTLLTDIGRHAEALDHFGNSIRLARSRLEEDPIGLAVALNNAGIGYRNVRDFFRAESAFNEALDLLRTHSNKNEPLRAALLYNQGQLYQLRGEYQLAKAKFEQSLALRSKMFGADHVSCGSLHQALGSLYNRAGDYPAAAAEYERARKIWKAELEEHHPHLSDALSGEAVAYAGMGEFQEAKSMLVDAVRIRQASYGPHHMQTASALSNLAKLLFANGEKFRALNFALQAESISREQLRHFVRAVPERVGLGYAQSRASGLDLALTIVARQPQGAAVSRTWDELIRSRALILDEMTGRRHLGNSEPDAAVIQARERFADASRRLAHLSMIGPDKDKPQTYRGLMVNAFDAVETAERELARLSDTFRREQEVRSAGVDDLAARLPEGSALVAYVRYQETGVPSAPDQANSGSLMAGVLDQAYVRPHYLAFVLPAGARRPRAVELGAASEIEGLMIEWSRSARNALDEEGAYRRGAEDEYRQVADRLRARIWDPVADLLESARRVVIVPDGSLHLTNFASLPSAAGTYLLEDGPEFHYLSAERDLLSRPYTARPGTGLLAIGGADYESPEVFASHRSEPASAGHPERVEVASLSLVPEEEPVRGACGALRSAKFGRLASAEREAVEVVDLWNRARGRGGRGGMARVLSGSEASEKSFKDLAPGRRILHVATHGFFFGDACPSASLGTRGVVLADPSEETQPLPLVGDSPLLFSGFALAGANLRAFAGEDEEDGILTAQEISAMDLGGLDLAVLAGCDTGAGRIENGEGVLGLRRAFKTAGAESILMSLWSIQDEVAHEWMIKFYERRLLGNDDLPGAVRKASLGVLNGRREKGMSTHPYYWGGWIASGVWQ